MLFKERSYIVNNCLLVGEGLPDKMKIKDAIAAFKGKNESKYVRIYAAALVEPVYKSDLYKTKTKDHSIISEWKTRGSNKNAKIILAEMVKRDLLKEEPKNYQVVYKANPEPITAIIRAFSLNKRDCDSAIQQFEKLTKKNKKWFLLMQQEHEKFSPINYMTFLCHFIFQENIRGIIKKKTIEFDGVKLYSLTTPITGIFNSYLRYLRGLQDKSKVQEDIEHFMRSYILSVPDSYILGLCLSSLKGSNTLFDRVMKETIDYVKSCDEHVIKDAYGNKTWQKEFERLMKKHWKKFLERSHNYNAWLAGSSVGQ